MVDITKTSSLTTLGTTTGTKASSGSGATDTTTAQDEATKSAQDQKDQFLQILLTQMQNQNPLDPMDTKDLTSQLAQFSSLEQQINTNSKLDTLLSAVQSTASTSAFNYIGQTAELNSKDTVVEGGEVDWNYTVNSSAPTMTIKISDESGKTLYTKDLKDVASGTYSFKALTTDLNSEVSEGQVLTLTVTAKDITGTAIRSDISTTVKVDGVESSSDGIDLRSGGLLYSLDDVIRFKTVTPTTTTTTTDTTSTAA